MNTTTEQHRCPRCEQRITVTDGLIVTHDKGWPMTCAASGRDYRDERIKRSTIGPSWRRHA